VPSRKPEPLFELAGLIHRVMISETVKFTAPGSGLGARALEVGRPPRIRAVTLPRARHPAIVSGMQIPLTPRRWQRVEYERLVELGVSQGEPLELIGGQLVVAEFQGGGIEPRARSRPEG
jgi:hypothetical protein